MKIQFIRNATFKIEYAGKTILADPMLSEKGAFQSFAGIAPNPTVSLPISAEDILTGVDCVLVSHNHPDHFDAPASEQLNKNTPIFCQPGDEDLRKKEGFKSVTAIADQLNWEGITITRTGGKHGKGKILEMMGKVSGFVFQAVGEPTVYWVGDSIWCPEVADALTTYQPDIVITHSGQATIPEHEPIIMDGPQTMTTIKAAPKAKVVAIHLESLDHCFLSRKELRDLANDEGISPEQLLIPADGELMEF